MTYALFRRPIKLVCWDRRQVSMSVKAVNQNYQDSIWWVFKFISYLGPKCGVFFPHRIRTLKPDTFLQVTSGHYQYICWLSCYQLLITGNWLIRLAQWLTLWLLTDTALGSVTGVYVWQIGFPWVLQLLSTARPQKCLNLCQRQRPLIN